MALKAVAQKIWMWPRSARITPILQSAANEGRSVDEGRCTVGDGANEEDQRRAATKRATG